MKKYLFIVLGLLLFSSVGCRKRLDSFLFNNLKVDNYLLDLYKDGELDLPNSYAVPLNDVFQFKYFIDDEGKDLGIAAIYIGDTANIKTDTVILYCHGNAKHMDNYWNRQKLLSHVGGYGRYGVLMFDYPGYGMSDGDPTESNMYSSTNGALKWLRDKGLTNERLIIYGYSLGSASASKAVGDAPFVLQPNKIILEAPFASSEVMVQDASVVAMPASFFVDTKIDNAEQIKKCTVPLLWMHGIDDDFLSIETHGRVVYENHKNNWKIKKEVGGAGHNNVPTYIGYSNYVNFLFEFIQSPND